MPTDRSTDYPSVAVGRFKEILGRYQMRVFDRLARYSSGESLLLRTLVLHDGPLHPTELRQRTCTSSARVASVLKSLEGKGLVMREADGRDRRRVQVTVTPEGRARAQQEIDEMDEEAQGVFEKMGKRDTEEFIRLLDRMLEVFVSQGTGSR
ncbi:MAG: winged helix DNA-binding protein [Coriobacteriales bacterium]|nr:winged helix DNA-binding protein [Coriobacteriales bacterium]